MTAKDIQTLYEFNYWAKDRILGVVEKLTPEQFTKDLKSSHGGIHGTLAHTLGAEDIWLKRWTGVPITGFLKPADVPTFADLQNKWKTVATEILNFCGTLKSDNDIQKIIVYKDLKGNEYRQPMYQLMQHIVNHSSYHRGQVVTMLRQLGVQPIGTDMVGFFREKN